MKLIDIVLPCFNEEETLPRFINEFLKLRERLGEEYLFSLIIVDNGSSDKTFEIAKKFVVSDPGSKVIRLSRNFGKEASLTAGLMRSTGQACIPMDADLQDPMIAVDKLVGKWSESDANVVLGVRSYHSNHSQYRIFLSKFYTKIFNYLSDVPLERSVGEFRLMDRKVIQAFRELDENQRFVRGIFAWLGFKTESIIFERNDRLDGEGKFNSFHLIKLGLIGITAFSIKPLRIATYLGFFLAMSSILTGGVVFILAGQHKIIVPGYASLIIAILVLGGAQLLCIGILGEYLGKTLLESKNRPIYVISDEVDGAGNSSGFKL